MIIFDNLFEAKLKLDFSELPLSSKCWAKCTAESFQSLKPNPPVASCHNCLMRENATSCSCLSPLTGQARKQVTNRTMESYLCGAILQFCPRGWSPHLILSLRSRAQTSKSGCGCGFRGLSNWKSMWCHRVYFRIIGSKGFHTATFPYSTLTSQSDVCLLGVYSYFPGNRMES